MEYKFGRRTFEEQVLAGGSGARLLARLYHKVGGCCFIELGGGCRGFQILRSALWLHQLRPVVRQCHICTTDSAKVGRGVFEARCSQVAVRPGRWLACVTGWLLLGGVGAGVQC